MTLSDSRLKDAQNLGLKFVKFLNSTGSPFHSVKHLVKYLYEHNVPLTHLRENDPWSIENGKTYYIANNNGTLMVFNIGQNFNPRRGGLILVCSHTDSPCLKLDSKCHLNNKGFNQLSVTTYGGGLWHTWMDRDLGVAGRVVVRTKGTLEERLVHLQKPLFFMPNLAIHFLTPQERESLKLNKDTHLKPVVSTEVVHTLTKSETEPLLKLLSDELKCHHEDLVDFELCLMDSNPSCISGVYNEFVSSGRLDNLGSCFGSAAAFAEFVLSDESESSDAVVVTVSYNYEEIGSSLSYGANSNVTLLWLEKVFNSLGSSLINTRNRALVVSADMAHSVHPNYPEKHISTHSPMFHQGVVLKWNVNGKYATEVQASSILKQCAKNANVPLQEFRVGNETPCGSTVGPMLGRRLCVPVADLGFVQLAMHSCREVCSLVDLLHFKEFLVELFKSSPLLDSYKSYTY